MREKKEERKGRGKRKKKTREASPLKESNTRINLVPVAGQQQRRIPFLRRDDHDSRNTGRKGSVSLSAIGKVVR